MAHKKINNALRSDKPKWHIVKFFLLSDQVSNLDSSEPKSDVLPVTPSDNFPRFIVWEHKYTVKILDSKFMRKIFKP